MRPIIAAILVLPFFAILGSCLPAPPLVSGTLSGDLAWNGSIVLRGDVVVAEGSRLVIAPGTTVLFAPPRTGEDLLVEHPHFPGSELIVRGSLVAEGTAAAPITFRHLDPAAPRGSWGGINLQQSPLASFRFCRFTQADSAVHSQESTVIVEQSVFQHNQVGIRFHSSRILVENNLLQQNGTGIRFHFGAPVICRNDIRDNDKGLFITSSPKDFLIEANNIVNNRDWNVVLGEEVPADVPMPGNWWGTGDPEAIGASFFDGRRDPWLGRVGIDPFSLQPVATAGASWRP